MAHAFHPYPEPGEKIRLPLDRRILAFGFAGALAVAAAIFSIAYYAADTGRGFEPTAEGLIPEELVPEYLEEYVYGE